MTKILLADDDESFRPAVQKSLEKRGFVVVPASDGKMAQELFLNDSFSVVISDIRMPEVDGIALTKFIKNSNRPVPVVLMTGFSDIIETKTAYDLGADEFLPKPLDLTELSAVIMRCLVEGQRASRKQSDAGTFCQIGIEDFSSGRHIPFSIYLRLSANVYAKIAHRGEDISSAQIHAYKAKGVHHLYLRTEDFRSYVGFSLPKVKAAEAQSESYKRRKASLLKAANELLTASLPYEGINRKLLEESLVFVRTTLDVIADDSDILHLFENFNSREDDLFIHSLASCLYCAMLAQELDWRLPNNKFKVVLAGLFHDIGEKEIDVAILKKGRQNWTPKDVEIFETHPYLGAEALQKVGTIPEDVIQITLQHHEDCLAQGFPKRLRKSQIHPIAKLVAVVDQFCERTSAGNDGRFSSMTPRDAIHELATQQGNRLEAQYVDALGKIFNVSIRGAN
jgi:response regulator RpfG family c-di-GMP phosphodiesterase